MNENNIIRRQQLQNMKYNLIAFTIIFISFGLIIFTQIRESVYTKLDSELYNSLGTMKSFVLDQNFNLKRPDEGLRPRGNAAINIRSPRIIPILRARDGSIINFGSVNDSYYDQYLKYIEFDKEKLNRIVSISIRDQYYFRSITTNVGTDAGEELYMQLVINSDGERNLLQHTSFILIVGVIIFSIMSILASLILSQITMKPVKKSWSRQVEFVENVSHELRTPLTIIQNSLELLLTSPEDKIIDRSESIAIALDETSWLSRLITDMLTLARSDSTMTEIHKDLFSLDALVETVCQPYRDLAESQNKVLEVNLHCPMNINADKSRIHQLLVILLDNALKYTDEKDRISVDTNIKDNKAVITVSDTGMGISDENIDKIFDRFFREDKARSRERGGMGLGLSIADWIVDRHGGTIKVTHNEPKGSIFTIKLSKG